MTGPRHAVYQGVGQIRASKWAKSEYRNQYEVLSASQVPFALHGACGCTFAGSGLRCSRPTKGTGVMSASTASACETPSAAAPRASRLEVRRLSTKCWLQ